MFTNFRQQKQSPSKIPLQPTMFIKIQLHKIFETISKKPKTPNYIYRNELDKKQALPRKLQRSTNIDSHQALKFLSELEQPLLSYDQDKVDDHHQKREIKRVKVLMTKKEATELLSKCKEKGILEFKDVVHQLVKLPAQRLSVVSINNTYSCQDMELDTIPEEDEEVLNSF